MTTATTTATTRLMRAADELDASLLPDGRWAHYDDEMCRWYTVTAAELASLVDYLEDEDEQISGDAYSHWCAGTTSCEMPADWTPQVQS